MSIATETKATIIGVQETWQQSKARCLLQMLGCVASSIGCYYALHFSVFYMVHLMGDNIGSALAMLSKSEVIGIAAAFGGLQCCAVIYLLFGGTSRHDQ